MPVDVTQPATLLGPLRAFVQQGLILDPWLAGLGQDYFSPGSQELLYNDAEALATEHWQEPLISQTIGNAPVPERLARTAAHEILISTAATVAHEQRGKIHISSSEAMEAMRRLHRLVRGHGFGVVVLVYAMVTFAENHTAVHHYGAIPEDEFVRGTRHRPWVRYRLDDELISGVARGMYALEVREGRRWVVQTEAGARYYQEVRRLLEDSGYLKRRLQLIYLSQFNLFQDWDANVAKMMPDALAWRRSFTAFTSIQAGMKVLEVGCGMATQTFEGGLWEAVGPTGHITGLDPAPGMLERAKAKTVLHGAKNVAFVSGQAERMPFFEAATFDATVGVLFLHFTVPPQALVELRRVTRPGGTVAVLAACQISFDAPWFREWFAPIFDLARQHDSEVEQHLHRPGDVASWFEHAGLQELEVCRYDAAWFLTDPEMAVYSLVQGVSFFQRELELLPWAARQELIDELKRLGERVCHETGPEERKLTTPIEFVKGIVPLA